MLYKLEIVAAVVWFLVVIGGMIAWRKQLQTRGQRGIASSPIHGQRNAASAAFSMALMLWCAVIVVGLLPLILITTIRR